MKPLSPSSEFFEEGDGRPSLPPRLSEKAVFVEQAHIIRLLAHYFRDHHQQQHLELIPPTATLSFDDFINAVTQAWAECGYSEEYRERCCDGKILKSDLTDVLQADSDHGHFTRAALETMGYPGGIQEILNNRDFLVAFIRDLYKKIGGTRENNELWDAFVKEVQARVQAVMSSERTTKFDSGLYPAKTNGVASNRVEKKVA